VKGGIFLWGYEQKLQDTRINLWITRFSRDLNVKMPSHLLPLAMACVRAYRGFLASATPAIRATRSTDEARNQNRRSRGSPGGAPRGRPREVAGFLEKGRSVAGLAAGSGGWRVAGGTCGSNMLLLGCDSGMGAEHRSRTRARRARQQGLHRTGRSS
jgi:hypothetical protein